VPLIVKPPKGAGLKARRETASVEIIAIPATILQLAGVRDPLQQQLQATSLLAADPAHLSYSQTLYPFSSFGWSPLRSLETSEYQYVEAPEPELYDLVRDPGEQHNLLAERPAVASAMRQKLADLMQRFAPPEAKQSEASLSPDAAAKLRALGYLAYKAPSTGAAASSLPDPKHKLQEFNDILRATDLLQVGDFEGSRTLLESVQQQDPKMYLIPFLMAEGSTRSGNMAQATAEFRRTLELNPSFDQAMLGLARALHAQQQNDEARVWLKKALAYNPGDFKAWYQIAWIDMGEHRDDDAIADFGKVLAIQPNFGLAYRDLGMLRIRQKDYPEAAKQLARAAELGVEEAPLYNFLGIAYGQIGKPVEALKSYQRAVELDPQLAEAHLNVAIELAREGKREGARKEFQQACQLKPDFCQYIPPEYR
jgi:tetratricopeptide (TPR) repeat protein